jgi:CheY-like chemotaxis protein
MRVSRDGECGPDRPHPEQADLRQRRRRAVVVEDEFLVFLSLKDLLESLGCEVIGSAQDASSAVELVRSLRPDFVLMDLGLGGSDALAATRTITSETAARVIVVTAYGESRTRAAREAGASCLLTKPIQEAELAETIAQLITPATENQSLRGKAPSR